MDTFHSNNFTNISPSSVSLWITLQIVEMSLQVKRDMESHYLDPSSAHNPRLPLPHSTTDKLERQSVSSTATSSDDRNDSNSAVVESTSPPTTPNSALAGVCHLTNQRSGLVFTTNLIDLTKALCNLKT